MGGGKVSLIKHAGQEQGVVFCQTRCGENELLHEKSESLESVVRIG